MTSEMAVGRRAPVTLWVDVGVILGLAISISMLCVFAGVDLRLARLVHDPARPEIRDYTNMLSSYSFVVATACLAWLAVPALRRNYPLVSRCAGVFVMTLLVAVLGFIINLKIERDRPRPSEVVEFGGQLPYTPPFGDAPCACKSFPSSAAGFGYLLATPFFVLRRTRPSLARAFLVAGLAWGSYIGYGRMVANMHWLSDIVWSAALVLATASILSQIKATWLPDPGD